MSFLLSASNIAISARSIRSNSLRTILTLLIIIFGIMALVGMITALEGLKYSFLKNFSEVGANTFSIQEKMIFKRRERPKSEGMITYKQAKDFQKRYAFPAAVSVSYLAAPAGVIKYKDKKTNPKIRVYGVDENYILNSSLMLDKGRNFNKIEIKSGSLLCILGNSLYKDLFGANEVLGKSIAIGSVFYKVIGVLEEKGSFLGASHDDIVLIPLETARRNMPYSSGTYNLSVKVADIDQMDKAQMEAMALFRIIRSLKPKDPNNFEIRDNASMIDTIDSQLAVIKIVAIIISLITLIGSSVALMNIMLVSVKERTREIGTIKAIGASLSAIRNQFLLEAILISQTGGIIGILLGILIGNILAYLLGSVFFVPWTWVILAYITSLLVGILSGYYPAIKASNLDPVEALRYE
jgi:putative ABC transport system permease protein